MRTMSFTTGQPEEIKRKIGEIRDQGFSPGIAFAFATPSQDIKGIAAAFNKSDIHLMGCSTGGNILTNGNDNPIFENETVITLVEVDPDYYTFFSLERQLESSAEFGRMIGSRGAEHFGQPSFLIIASGLHINGEELVLGIQDTAGEDVIMFGGLAGDDAEFQKNFVFTKNSIIDSGAVVLVFDSEKVSIEGLNTSGWVGLGKDLSITSAEGNIVYSIDNQPALEVYKKYLSVQDEDMPAIGVEYPLLIKRDDGDFTLRAVMDVDRERRALIFAGTVPQDATVTFSSSPGFEVIDRTKQEINRFHQYHQEADMLLLISCMARHLALGPMISEEIFYPAEMWELPVSGFFSYGEIGTNEKKQCYFFNQTYTLVVIKEK